MKTTKPLMTRSEALKPVWERGANAEQLEVIRHSSGPCRVLAAAGSGKTFAVVRRIVQLTKSGVRGKRILAMTFSKKAAGEMDKRVKKLGISDVRIGTWHSLCAQILREGKVENDRGDVVSTWEVDEKNQAKYVLKDVLGFKGMDWKGHDLTLINNFITHCKANLFTPESPQALELATKMVGGRDAQKACQAFHRYNEALADKGLLTFDDMMVFAIEYLESDEEARATWAAKFDHGLCDEVQDNNGAQERLSYLLFKDHGNYMAVGDCFQAIYSFRGSSPAYLANFEKYWPGARTIILPSNYRSGKKIIEAANGIVCNAHIEGLEPTPMVAMREDEGEVRVLCAESLDDEAAEVANAIQTSIKSGDTELTDHTVLFRTNAQSRGIEEALLNRRIPYIVIGGVSFYDRKEVRDLLAYMRLACGRGTLEDIKRSINTPFRFLGAKFVERITDEVDLDETKIDWPSLVDKVADGDRLQGRQRASAHDWSSMLRDMQKAMAASLDPAASPQQKDAAKPAVLLEDIIRRTRYIDFLNKEEGSESTENSGAANVREMVRVAERFPTSDDLLDYIDDTLRKARQQREDKQAGGERVLLMSIHRSKGLEWPRVYVIGLNEMILPHVRGDEEEERRVAYVAATRARDVLCLSYVRRVATRAGIKEAHPSRFLIDTGLPLDRPGEGAPAKSKHWMQALSGGPGGEHAGLSKVVDSIGAKHKNVDDGRAGFSNVLDDNGNMAEGPEHDVLRDEEMHS